MRLKNSTQESEEADNNLGGSEEVSESAAENLEGNSESLGESKGIESEEAEGSKEAS